MIYKSAIKQSIEIFLRLKVDFKTDLFLTFSIFTDLLHCKNCFANRMMFCDFNNHSIINLFAYSCYIFIDYSYMWMCDLYVCLSL